MSAAMNHGAADFASIIGPVARHLLGQPTARSTKDLLYFGSNNGSLEVDLLKGVWCDHTLDIGGGTLKLVEHVAHVDKTGALGWLENHRYIEPSSKMSKKPGKIVAVYNYHSATGDLLYQVCRYDPKDFRQRRSDGQGGWNWSVKGIERVPYRLPELLAANPIQPVFIAEGEKDVDNLTALGFVATCNAGGAAQPGQHSKWPREFAKYFKGRNAIILPHNDEAGEAHALAIADNISGNSKAAQSVRILRLPDLRPKGDVSDWLAAGGTAEMLLDLVSDAPPFDREVFTDSFTPKGIDLNEDKAVADFELNEDGVALAFADTYRGKLLYDHHACHWFVWNGNVWKREQTQLAFSWARKICRNSRNLESDGKDRSALAKAAAAAAVERFAKSDRAFAIEADVWDKNAWLLGTPEGTLDLKTGLLKPSDPADRISKSLSVAPAPPGTPHPVWTAFLNQATDEDEEFQGFLQRFAGYCLTGEVTEEILSFIYGEGGTGKGTFLRTIVSIMADYAISVPIEVFTAGAKINLEYYRAQMAGARLITASETEKGATWAETQIKEMTGNEAPLSGRHPYGKPFTFMPQFKILIVGNHAPKLKARSKEMERRLRIAPFKHLPARVDKTLKEKLKAEYPAILRWMVNGCLVWRRMGIGSAAVVDAASSSYFEDQDTFGDWLQERCIIARTLEEQPAKLLSDYLYWAKNNNEAPLDKKDFKELIERTPSLIYSRSGGNNRVKGIGLRPSKDEQSAQNSRYPDA